jgi:hypothetical protein
LPSIHNHVGCHAAALRRCSRADCCRNWHISYTTAGRVCSQQ